MWTPVERNFDGIQHEQLRRVIDSKYNSVHDELSDAYYSRKPFRDYGILDKVTFDKLHSLIFLKREVEFHEENLKQALEDIIPEAEYNNITDSKGVVVSTRVDEANQMITSLKAEGIDLVI